MFRGLRHTVYFLLQLGILLSGGLALAIEPGAWRAILVAVGGAVLTAHLCASVMRHYLRASLGRLRRVADDLGHGRPAEPLEAHPGDDLHKLITAINLLAARLADASREETRLHEQLRRTERLAFLGELAASVAHEVNNPLDGVQNCARILRRSLDDPQRTRQMLDLIDSGLVRIETIVRRLLTLARENVIRPEPVRLADVVRSAVVNTAARTAHRGVRVIEEPGSNNDRVLADRLLLEQVFVNLILNAADSMAAGGELRISVSREAPARDLASSVADGASALRVNFADSGPGIAPDVLPHIFEPFFTTKPHGKGTGLGLPIAARIVDAHRGAIEVLPRPDGGTIFSVTIPALSAAAVTRDAPVAALAVAAPEPTTPE